MNKFNKHTLTFELSDNSLLFYRWCYKLLIMNFIKRMKYFNIKNFICSKIGHRWTYHFSLSDYHNKGRKVRCCKRCYKAQIIKDFAIDFTGNNINADWSTMIGCTDLGAKKKFKPEHLKN